MSVAFDYPLDLADQVVTSGQRVPAPVRLASVTELRSPDARSITPPLRLTRRGVVVLGAVVAVLAGALITTAWRSAPDSASGSISAPIATTVVVRAGDSLWSLAERVAPNTDPRAEVAILQRINRLRDSTLQPGQLLRTK